METMVREPKLRKPVVTDAEFKAWFRAEYNPVGKTVEQIVTWVEVYGRGQRRYRHYMAALFDALSRSDLEQAFGLAQYMSGAICPFEMAQDYLAILRQAREAGAYAQAALFKDFVLTFLVDEWSCKAALALVN